MSKKKNSKKQPSANSPKGKADDKGATPKTAKAETEAKPVPEKTETKPADKPTEAKPVPEKTETKPATAAKPKENPDNPPVVDRRDTRTEEELLAILEATKDAPHRNPITKQQKNENGINRSKRREAQRALKALRNPDAETPAAKPAEESKDKKVHATEKALKDFADFAQGAAEASLKADNKPNVAKVTAAVNAAEKSAEESAEAFAAQADAAEAIADGNAAVAEVHNSTNETLKAAKNFRKELMSGVAATAETRQPETVVDDVAPETPVEEADVEETEPEKQDEGVNDAVEGTEEAPVDTPAPAQEPEQPETPAEETATPDATPEPAPEVSSEPVTEAKPAVAEDVEPKEANDNVVPLKKSEPKKKDAKLPERPSAASFYGDVYTPETGPNLDQALYWLNRAIVAEAEGNNANRVRMMLDNALKYEGMAFANASEAMKKAA